MLKDHTKLEITTDVIRNEQILSSIMKTVVVTYTGTGSARQSAVQDICDSH